MSDEPRRQNGSPRSVVNSTPGPSVRQCGLVVPRATAYAPTAIAASAASRPTGMRMLRPSTSGARGVAPERVLDEQHLGDVLEREETHESIAAHDGQRRVPVLAHARER